MMAIVFYSILLTMAEVFQLNGILTSEEASEKFGGIDKEEKCNASAYFFPPSLSIRTRVCTSWMHICVLKRRTNTANYIW